MPEKNILVLCTGNSVRSIMTEAILKKAVGGEYNVYSAGLDPNEINPLTVKVLTEKGFDTKSLRSKSVNEYLGKMTFDFVIFVCVRAEKNCPVTFLGSLALLSWPFEDPTTFEGSEAAKLERFRKTFTEIENKVRDWVQESKEFEVRVGKIGSK